jgi:hypothetical protein
MGPVERDAGMGAVPRRILAIVLAGLLPAGLLVAQPIGTSFTYQGRLTDAGNPANGSYDLQLALFDAATGGAQVGSTITRDDVAVVDGLFTVGLDFGAAFAGSRRFLELRVRPGASTGAYTPLGGRQELTPAPYAAFSTGAPWAGIAGKPAGFADDTDNDELGALACPNGQIAKRVGGAWACADDADSGGDVTGVTAGTGLTGGGTSGAVTLSASLAGSGSASTIARSDHDHFAQSWSGSTANGLTVANAGGTALRGSTTAAASTAVIGSSQASTGIGVHGQALGTTFGRGVVGEAASSSGSGVYGVNTAAGGVGVEGGSVSTAGTGAAGVYGWAQGLDSYGVRGSASSTTGSVIGVLGQATSPEGKGVWGNAYGSTGTGVGVQGTGRSPDGLGGYFQNISGSAPALGVDEGGIRFGDGSIQTSAATGDITGVTAGTGLTGGGTSGAVTLGVNFGGSGAQNTVSHSDHTHFNQVWSGGSSLVSFQVVNTTESVGGFRDGIFGQANSGNSSARGLVGYAPGGPGVNYGVWGQADSGQGRGVYGIASANSGVNYGVYGQTNSPAGYAGYFEGNVGIPGSGKLLFGTTARQVIDLNSASYGIGVQGGVVYFRTEPPGGMFTWFMGGSHSNTQNDPGPGGVRNMRLDGAGNLFVRGSYFSGGADFAEMLPAVEGLEPGDVLAIGPDGTLSLTTEPYQESLAGVFSTKPGLVGGVPDGEKTDGKVPLAVAGIVPVKVTDENGAVRPGDLLTSSSIPGQAMRASRDKVTVGVVLGKALDPLAEGTGVIRALVVLQ